jgi:hypothetical protein
MDCCLLAHILIKVFEIYSPLKCEASCLLDLIEDDQVDSSSQLVPTTLMETTEYHVISMIVSRPTLECPSWSSSPSVADSVEDLEARLAVAAGLCAHLLSILGI